MKKKNDIKKEYDFSKGKRGSVIPHKNKTRITIWIDTDILEWFKNYPDFKPVFSTDEITKAVQRAISLGEEEIRSLIARGKKKTEELFYPATEETLKAFLT